MPQTSYSLDAVAITPTPDFSLLDNPIWNALSTEQRHFAHGDALARRYPAEIGPLSGLLEDASGAYGALHALTRSGDAVALFLESPYSPQRGWKLVRDGRLDQMICSAPVPIDSMPLPGRATLRELTAADVPDMVMLAELTEPGPFRTGTSSLGRFFGIFERSRLVAMAGQRLHMPGLREVSAVCTHPDARGHGYARIVMARVMNDIVSRGELPFLHVFATNESAIRVYAALGFARRRSFELAVLQSD
jgi:GNAT superfamily N-acetyltransferase